MDKKKVFTIPNLMSFFRLCLVPLIVYIYVAEDRFIFATLLIVLSGISDIVDGIIARKFNMTSELGKVLDPLADKVTQLAMIICVLSKYAVVKYLLIIFVIKEVSQLFVMREISKITSSVEPSHWFGKLCTVTLYISSMFLFVFPEIPNEAVLLMVCLCSVLIIASLMGYIRALIRYSRESRNN